jgi:phosphopentomutase
VKRAIVIVLDGCGAGAAPDAAKFGDLDHPSTLAHVWERAGGIHAPNLIAAGLFAAAGVKEAPASAELNGKGVRYGRLQEKSMGKDSVTGHWEMMGIHTAVPFPTYPNGFPADLVAAFEDRIGRKVLGNKPASGTGVVDELGPVSQATGNPILYTSADSVFQVAAHEGVIPIEQLYEFCRIARELCVAPNNVQRVIARPFEGEPGAYRRTERRKDFPLVAPDNLVDKVGDVFGVGVIPELFGGRGFRAVRRTQNNAEHAVMLREAMASDARFIFANFEDFDMLYGHRNDPAGFAKALADFDSVFAEIVGSMTSEDLLILTADHGNDPTSTSTDHSREYVPVCVLGSGCAPKALGDVVGMDAVGATAAAHLGIDWPHGANLLKAGGV